MTTISSVVLHRLHTTLARCAALEDDRALRVLFTDARLQPWADRMPQNAPDQEHRIQQLIVALRDAVNDDDEGALEVLLRVLADNAPPESALQQDLLDLVAALRAVEEKIKPLCESQDD